jgi:hypothetical protein
LGWTDGRRCGLQQRDNGMKVQVSGPWCARKGAKIFRRWWAGNRATSASAGETIFWFRTLR